MTEAPKAFPILVSETPNGEHYNTVVAYWGTPDGFAKPAWWGTSFSLVFGDPLKQPELHSRLIALKPLCWKPLPRPRKQPKPLTKKRWYHYAIMTKPGGKGTQQGCANGVNMKVAESYVDSDCKGKLRKMPKSKCKECNQ